ncbi:MAG: phosphoribosylamine--glycine ligase [Clostridia bacterium]|nr:phosphoribosylamine--glycine ligase [Clostridia bacterium]
MDILVVGGGGREHAIIKKLRANPKTGRIYALPGNGGIAAEAECVDIQAKDIEGIVSFAVAQKIDFAVVAPDDPLVLGAVDRLHEAGIPCFGPNAAAAAIEGSKSFAKNLMRKYGIPTAQFRVFDAYETAAEYLATTDYPLVVKADGLALGKGVLICGNQAAAQAAVQSILVEKRFGSSGDKVVVEEFLRGPEVSVLAFTDGRNIVPMVSSMDHKRALEGDQGLNTGGMGAIAPNPYYTEEIAGRCMREIFQPTVRAMVAEGRPFKGCLYFGLMLTKNGPKVIEYNCRFGDPEAQVVLPLLETDLLDIMLAVEEERLGKIDIRFKPGAACCVIMASAGYPEQYQTGYPISDDSDGSAIVYHAGTSRQGDSIVSAGGRVLGVTATADTLRQAIDGAYAAVGKISFANAYFRRDIGRSALLASHSKER